MEKELLNILLFSIPALITGSIAYIFFKEYTSNENNRRQFLISKDLQKETIPIRLQAYERMVLFLERIKPTKLLLRVKPLTDDKNEYESLLIANIEQEFDHNLAQQIYVSEECWVIITTVKNTTIQLIRKSSMNSDSAQKLQENILTNLIDKPTPSNAALTYIRKEVSGLW